MTISKFLYLGMPLEKVIQAYVMNNPDVRQF